MDWTQASALAACGQIVGAIKKASQQVCKLRGKQHEIDLHLRKPLHHYGFDTVKARNTSVGHTPCMCEAVSMTLPKRGPCHRVFRTCMQGDSAALARWFQALVVGDFNKICLDLLEEESGRNDSTRGAARLVWASLLPEAMGPRYYCHVQILEAHS